MKLRTYRECGEKGNIFFFLPVLSDSVAIGIVDRKAKKCQNLLELLIYFGLLQPKKVELGRKLREEEEARGRNAENLLQHLLR